MIDVVLGLAAIIVDDQRSVSESIQNAASVRVQATTSGLRMASASTVI